VTASASADDSSSTKTTKELAWAAFRDGYKMGKCVEGASGTSTLDEDSENPRKSVEHVQKASLEAAQAEFDVWWRLHASERNA